MKVIGLDLSLASTGIAVAELGGAVKTRVCKPKKATGLERLEFLCRELLAAAEGAQLVVVEGPSYGSTGSGQHERAGLWWLVVHSLWKTGTPTAVVPPTVLKKFATGTGTAGKDAVLTAAVRRFPDFNGGNDEADALWLAAAGAEYLGRPLTDLPVAQKQVLAKVAWP